MKVVAKKSYGRGAGTPLHCGANEDYDAGLCYPKCPGGTTGVGPVCWAKQGPKGFPKKCNAITYGKSDDDCHRMVKIFEDHSVSLGGYTGPCLAACILAVAAPPLGVPLIAGTCATSAAWDVVHGIKTISDATHIGLCPAE